MCTPPRPTGTRRTGPTEREVVVDRRCTELDLELRTLLTNAWPRNSDSESVAIVAITGRWGSRSTGLLVEDDVLNLPESPQPSPSSSAVQAQPMALKPAATNSAVASAAWEAPAPASEPCSARYVIPSPMTPSLKYAKAK